MNSQRTKFGTFTVLMLIGITLISGCDRQNSRSRLKKSDDRQTINCVPTFKAPSFSFDSSFIKDRFLYVYLSCTDPYYRRIPLDEYLHRVLYDVTTQNKIKEVDSIAIQYDHTNQDGRKTKVNVGVSILKVVSDRYGPGNEYFLEMMDTLFNDVHFGSNTFCLITFSGSELYGKKYKFLQDVPVFDIIYFYAHELRQGIDGPNGALLEKVVKDFKENLPKDEAYYDYLRKLNFILSMKAKAKAHIRSL